MYNGQKINELLKERNLRAIDLLNHLGVRDNGTVARFTGSDIKASRLEQIADFFGVSTDTFFIRDGVFDGAGIVIVGDKNTTNGNSVGSASSRAREYESKCKSLERELADKDALIAEKERTINTLLEMINILKPKN